MKSLNEMTVPELWAEANKLMEQNPSDAKVGEIRQMINEKLFGDNLPANPTSKIYYEAVSEKPFMKNIRKIIEGVELSDIALAKVLSSHITHALIEMERVGDQVYDELHIAESAKMLASCLTGEESSESVCRFITETFSGAIK
jgi:hypothetical protein